MKFILNEVKLWFEDAETASKSYTFLPNKVNVITGDATTGKTSFWRIIDYCLLSNRTKIANAIIERVSWFGINFTINGKEVSIARKSPDKGAVNAGIFFNNGKLPDEPIHNADISDVKRFLDTEFGIAESLKFPLGQASGRVSFNISYRHFLLFNSLTEDIIGSSETYFDTTFYGKEEYDKAVSSIFDIVIGINDMANIKAKERIQYIENEVRKIHGVAIQNTNAEKKFQKGALALIDKLKEYQLLDYSLEVESADNALAIIEDVISNTKRAADNAKLFEEIDTLTKQSQNIKDQLTSIEKYRREFEAYKRNLSKSADSLKPIEFLNNKLSDQLVDSYETKNFIDLLESSLKEIQNNLSKNSIEPLKISGDEKELKNQLKTITDRIVRLHTINKNFQSEGVKFMIAGEVKNAREQLIQRYVIKKVDQTYLATLGKEKEELELQIRENGQTKLVMKNELNKSIQRNFDLLKSMPEYKNCETIFDDSSMTLQLRPKGQFFVLENIGSKSNYMFMHLCFYLGLHEHMIAVSSEHVPQFLFIDQPSIPYYSGNDSIGNNDKSKLIDAFNLLNSFVEFIAKEKKSTFQILMVEHAPKEYWTENGMTNFHTVAEFINNNGLIPKEVYS